MLKKFPIIFPILALLLMAGCKQIQVPNAKIALARFCEHPGPDSALSSTPEEIKFCNDHFEVTEEGQNDWYIKLKPQYWQRSKKGGIILGLVIYSVDKADGKVRVSSIID